MFSNMGFAPLPIIFAVILIVQSFSIYTWAVLKGDVDPVFPYLSSAADRRPQSCFFAMGGNICSFLLTIIVYVRYHQMKGIFTTDPHLYGSKANSFSKFFGWSTALGMFIVSNVQETAIIPVHMAAAVLTFGSFNIYMILQTYMTIKTTPKVTRISMVISRSICAVCGVISMICAITFGITASHIFHSYYPDLPTPRPWNRKIWQPGYGFHQVSAAFEWICATSQIAFIVSFVPEFEEINGNYYLLSEKYIPPPPPRESDD